MNDMLPDQEKFIQTIISTHMNIIIKKKQKNVAVYKYPLKLDSVNEITMPKDAQILTTQSQNDVGTIWALVDTKEPKTEKRIFLTVATGAVIDNGDSKLEYVGSYLINNDSLVWHIFEVLSKKAE